ncbi:multiple epidermal growth factor-like domains protein 10 [Lingula anatina]|uniref:Multiple epidermal growth factor-like domains protein 10 n=1 Tax=Lingula anatina TaxID=7574 RepID=A0A1S3HN80_LINAN|nr:multiple epidermal growth factor-like domains protein 10 [Lingula anatina]|eukprot:XP_013387523.2 multiple epidermal growth factor-like domains protein 10 [Lingula anatina]
MGVCMCHANQLCNQTEGDCTCKPGWIGRNCTQTCPDGFYGEHCKESCLCQNNATCDPADGSCKCQSGWIGTIYLLCCILCPANERPLPSFVLACDSGMFGTNCSQTCRCGGRECDHVTGACFCDPGKRGHMCASDCPAGTYGQNCASKCQCTTSTTQKCDVVNGTCLCKDGWGGPFCAQESASSAMEEVQEAVTESTLIGVIVGVVFLVILILVVIFVVCFIQKRKRKKKSPHDTRSADSGHELTPFPGQVQEPEDEQRYAEPDVITDARPRKAVGNAEYEYVSNVNPKLTSSPSSQESPNIRARRRPPCAAPVSLKSPPKFRVVTTEPCLQGKETEQSEEKIFPNMSYFMAPESVISGIRNTEKEDSGHMPDSSTQAGPHEYSEIMGEEMKGKKDNTLPPAVTACDSHEEYDVIRLSAINPTAKDKMQPTVALNAYGGKDDLEKSTVPDVDVGSEYSKLDHTGLSFKRQMSGNVYGHLSANDSGGAYSSVESVENKYDTLVHVGNRHKKKVLSGSEYDALEPLKNSEMQI